MTSKAKAVPQKKTTPPAKRAQAGSPLVASALPLYAQLRDRLKQQILEGKLGPHAKLPSESELTAQYEVSRITVRQALNELHREGLIVRVHGKGSFVSQPVVAQDLTQLRGLSESLTGEGRVIHTRLLSHKTVKASETVAQRLGVAVRSPVSELRTVRYLNRSPLSLNHSYVSEALGERLRKADLANRDLIAIFENDFGMTITRADLSISALTADAAHVKPLGIELGAALLQVERVLLSPGDVPVQFELATYRSDRFSYSLSVERRRMG